MPMKEWDRRGDCKVGKGGRPDKRVTATGRPSLMLIACADLCACVCMRVPMWLIPVYAANNKKS